MRSKIIRNPTKETKASGEAKIHRAVEGLLAIGPQEKENFAFMGAFSVGKKAI